MFRRDAPSLSSPAECASAAVTVHVAPPALEVVTLTATGPSDDACDAQSGQLTFSVAASPALSAAQYDGATLTVTKGNVVVESCASTASADGFEVSCDSLADGSYDLAVSVPNTQYPGARCWGPRGRTVETGCAAGYSVLFCSWPCLTSNGCAGVLLYPFLNKLSQTTGCPYTGSVTGRTEQNRIVTLCHSRKATGTVSIIPAPGFEISNQPAAQTICPAASTSFAFTATGAGDGLVYTYSPEGGASCSQPDADGTVTCTGVAASVSVSAVAHYGQAQGGQRIRVRRCALPWTGLPAQPHVSCLSALTWTTQSKPLQSKPTDEDCTTEAISVPLTVAFDPTITATSVTALSPATLCPAVPFATVAFTVTTSSDAASLTAVLLHHGSHAAVDGVTCTATGSGTSWAVSCPAAPVGNSYLLSVAATSPLGCLYDLGVDATAVATVSAYDYTLSAGAALSAFACIGSLGKATVTVTATGLDGATFTATPSSCVRTAAPGVVFACTGLPAGPTTVVVTAVKTGGRCITHACRSCVPARSGNISPPRSVAQQPTRLRTRCLAKSGRERPRSELTNVHAFPNPQAARSPAASSSTPPSSPAATRARLATGAPTAIR
jgi:hypothetical protein